MYYILANAFRYESHIVFVVVAIIFTMAITSVGGLYCCIRFIIKINNFVKLYFSHWGY
jgi:hypothetical protein